MRFRVRAPASSANLGPGFDCLGMALDLWNEVRVTRGRGRISIRGEGASDLPTDDTNLVARAWERAGGGSRERIDLHCINRIPLARGLGSSTAAAALGLIAGWTVAERNWDPDLLFDELCHLDGHPDNAAACAFGGAVLAQTRPDSIVQPTLLDPRLDVVPLLLVPARHVETADARNALPTAYSQAELVQAVGAGMLLVTGLLCGDATLVREALVCDVVHEQQRAHLVPELAQVRSAIPSDLALGATISGAGPSVMVWCEPGRREDVQQMLRPLVAPTTKLIPIDMTPFGAAAVVDD